MIESPLALATVIAAATGLAFWLDYRFEALGKVGASMLAIIFGTILSNVGLVPVSSPIYGAVGGVVTSLAIAWLLLSVDLRDLRKAGPKMIGAFAIAVTGTALGAMVGAFVYQDRFGDNTWRLAGTLTGTYSGGSVNFVSVGRAFEIPDVLFAGATAADNMATGIWLAVTLMLPVWLGRFYPATVTPSDGPDLAEAAAAGSDGQSERHAHHPYFAHVKMSALQIANLMAVGLLLVFVSEWLGNLIPGVPAILWLTTLALVLGHTRFYREAPGALQMGSVALHFFFVLIGILSRFSEIVTVGIEVFLLHPDRGGRPRCRGVRGGKALPPGHRHLVGGLPSGRGRTLVGPGGGHLPGVEAPGAPGGHRRAAWLRGGNVPGTGCGLRSPGRLLGPGPSSDGAGNRVSGRFSTGPFQSGRERPRAGFRSSASSPSSTGFAGLEVAPPAAIPSMVFGRARLYD